MASKSRKWVTKLLLLIGILIALALGLNWFMTYKLEDLLKKRLRTEVIKATDGFYDVSFESLNIGFFSGELMIRGLSLFPDSAALDQKSRRAELPDFYIDIEIDTIHFTGVNLTWKFYYRELSFREFQLSNPHFKIVSTSNKQKDYNQSDTINKSLYELVSPYFDVVEAKHINFDKASVEYLVQDSIASHYQLRDFTFSAHNFLLDKNSTDRGYLLFSDDFDFITNTPQLVFDSKYLLLNLDRIYLNTKDSAIFVGGVDLQTKEEEWNQRFSKFGSYASMKVAGIEVNGIAFSRKGGYNFLDCADFCIESPKIEYYDVIDEKLEKKLKVQDESKSGAWSLYSITSPIIERLSINQIDIENANFTYVRTEDQLSDLYTLNKLDFHAYRFAIDSLAKDQNIVNYVEDFTIEASDVQSHISSRNTVLTVGLFQLSTINKNFRLTQVEFHPIVQDFRKNIINGGIEDFQIRGIEYNEGLKADTISVIKPKISFTKAEGESLSKNENRINNKEAVDNFLDVVAPFIDYVVVKDILIKDGRGTYTDNEDGSVYHINNLDFYAKNFHIDKETRRLRDYFFSWDEYDVRFRDFDNITPDKKYRIQIDRGDFNSISKDFFLENLKITPQKTNSSYISITTPYARLLGWDDKEIKNKNLSFESFVLENPLVEIVKKKDETIQQVEKEIKDIGLNSINFGLLTIPSLSFSFSDEENASSLQLSAKQLQLDSLEWNINKNFNIKDIIIDSPYLSVVNNKQSDISDSTNTFNILLLGHVSLDKMYIQSPVFDLKQNDTQINFTANHYQLDSFFWKMGDNSILKLDNFDLINPTIGYKEKGISKTKSRPLSRQQIVKTISKYANQIDLGRVNISDLDLLHTKRQKIENRLVDTDFLLENLHSNLRENKIEMEELAFSTKDIDFPVADSFYTFKIGDVNFSKRLGNLNINNISLNANYPKFDYAYIHPRGADWFNVEVDKIVLSGIDTDRFLADSMLFVDRMIVDHVLLENFKNQKIEIEHNKMPLLYEQFQKFPLKYHIGDLDIRDFTVIYEELAKNGYQPARIPFSNMNGRVRNFTNIQGADNSFYTLYANGTMMGAAPFTAEWTIPVDSVNDKFYLSAEINDLDMRSFNQLIRPMAPAYVKSGHINKLNFETEATSLGATVDMKLVYDSLYLVLTKNMLTDEENKLYTYVVNRWGIEKQNMGENLRMPNCSIVRDPYHSNFNYFWQILQPPLMESVGVSEEKQNLAYNLMTMYNKVKRFFSREKKTKTVEK